MTTIVYRALVLHSPLLPSGADIAKHEDLEVLEKQLVQEVSEIVSESDSLKKQGTEQEAAISNLKVEVMEEKER